MSIGTELAALTEDTTPDLTDWFYLVDAAGNIDKRVSLATLKNMVADVYAENPDSLGTYTKAPLYIGETDPALGGEEPYVWMDPSNLGGGGGGGATGDFVTHAELAADLDALPELVAADPFEQTYTPVGATSVSALTGKFDLGSGYYANLRAGEIGYRASGDTSARIGFTNSAGTPLLAFTNGTGGAAGQIAVTTTDLTLTGRKLVLAAPPAAGTNDASVATTAFVHRFGTIRHSKVVGDYYQDAGTSGTSAAAPALNRQYLWNKILPAGTLDRVGIEVSTLEAGSTSRLGIYMTDPVTGLPTTLIAEASSTTDNSTAGNKELIISAVLPKYDVYCWSFVTQGVSSAVRFRTVNSGSGIPIALGTSPPTTGANQATVRHISSVSGALTPTVSTLGSGETNNPPRIFYRFSA